MAGVWVTECRRSGLSENGQTIPVAELTTTQFLSVSAVATAFSAIGGSTKWVRIYADTNALVSFAGTAVQASTPIASALPEYFAIVPSSIIWAKTQ